MGGNAERFVLQGDGFGYMVDNILMEVGGMNVRCRKLRRSERRGAGYDIYESQSFAVSRRNILHTFNRRLQTRLGHEFV